MAVDAGTYQLGPAAGRVAIRTGRAGLAARAGHDLLIEVTRWSASVAVGADPAATSITAELDFGSLAVREGTGGAKPLSAKDRADIEKTMSKILGPGSAAFTSTRVTPSAAGGTVEGNVAYRGRTVPLRLAVTAAGPGAEPGSGSGAGPGAGPGSGSGPGRYRGTATVAQTAFGITPYTGFFGALKLRDEITLEFDVDLSRATRS